MLILNCLVFRIALKNLFEYINYKKTKRKVSNKVILVTTNIRFIDLQTLIIKL